jgi:LPS sulfotransferase NodH
MAPKFYAKNEYGKFVIISRSRTGSNFLISLLDSHEDIIAYGEKFHRLGNKDSSDIYNEIFPIQSNKVIGFKLFYYHPIDSEDKSIWEQLTNDRSFKIIHLRRNNLLRAHISKLIAEKTDNWSSLSKNSTDNKRVHIDIKELLDDFAITYDRIRRAQQVFKNHSILDVTYENLSNERENTIGEILRFLEVSPENVTSPYKKQNPEKLQDLVSNYRELYHCLINTEHSFMLEE